MPEKLDIREIAERAGPKAKKAGKLALRGILGAATASQDAYVTTKEKLRQFDDKHLLTGGAHERRRQEARKAHDQAYQVREVEEAQKRARATSEINEKSGFNIEAYAEKRKTAEPWVALEIGPHDQPCGLNRTFRGDSRYIGVEAHNPFNWVGQEHSRYSQTSRDRQTESTMAFSKIKTARPDENIDLFSGDLRSLPDSTADEIFAVYVYDDPETDVRLITEEAYRLLKPGGYFVVEDHDFNFHGGIREEIENQGFIFQYAEPSVIPENSTHDGPERQKYTIDHMKRLEMLGADAGHLGLELFIAQKPDAELH